ncbi:hypothetical protein ACKWTF_002015 [Chironomus riparius]
MTYKMNKISVCLITLTLCILIFLTSAQNLRSNRKKSRSNLQKDSILNYETNNDKNDGYSIEKEKQRRPDALKKRRKGSHQRNDYDLRQLPDSTHPFQRFVESSPNGGLFPKPFNVAIKAKITANATCGSEIEEFCRLADIYSPRQQSMCEFCDSSDPDLSHPITHTIDGSHSFWQSPSLAVGNEYEFVTIDIDLGQIFEIYSFKIKSAESPLPKAWILEKSIDGKIYEPWQYFATNNEECMTRYGLPGRNSNYTLQNNLEITCTSQYSESVRLKYGEAKFVVMAQRNFDTVTPELQNFSFAQYIRVKFQGLIKNLTEIESDRIPKWLPEEDDLKKRSYYSVQSIMIVGRCYCFGHAAKCRENQDEVNDDANKLPQCECMHNTCGKNCDKCCPLFNQREFRAGTPQKENKCEKCQCHGHASSCEYNADIDERNLSQNVKGKMIGGGVCVNCTKFTTGINCEKCLTGYYRPYDREPDHDIPCVPCDCSVKGSIGTCNPFGGECICKAGFSGPKCNNCAIGYGGSNCEKCSCDVRGTIPSEECEETCHCKAHVIGDKCDTCMKGYFGLTYENPDGCLKCYCSGIDTTCESYHVDRNFIETLEGWMVTDLSKTQIAYPVRDNDTGFYVFGMYELADVEAVYWSAPHVYLGNRLENYGSHFVFQIDYVIVRGDTSGKPTNGPNFIMIGKNGMKIAYGDGFFSNSNASVNVPLKENNWYHVPKNVKDIITRLRRTDYRGDPVTRTQFISVITDVESILIRGTYHTDQAEAILKRATLYSGDLMTSNEVVETKEATDISIVEKCNCPLGYDGLSCEKCMFGHISIFENTTTHERVQKCLPCNCNGHSETCDMVNMKCGECLHHTAGESCERCEVGFYGDATRGTVNDCKKCKCPLSEESNNFSDMCQMNGNSDTYICLNCPIGHIGDHCEKCQDGYYGDPMKMGSKCQACECNGDPCDPITGKCIKCERNTEGWRCEKCKKGFYGNPEIGCDICECSDHGSVNNICDSVTGKCTCQPNFTGKLCNQCDVGYTNVSLKCTPCDCNLNGSKNQNCDTNSGQCECKINVHGQKCDECDEYFFGLNFDGCEGCNCHVSGSEDRVCNSKTGQCKCRLHVVGRTCDRCENGYWNLDSKKGCEECLCNVDGSEHNICDIHTGQCACKNGIEGAKCDKCKNGYYGFSANGCKKCNTCDSSSKICDQETGRCVCPPLSHGNECQHCHPNTWGLVTLKGCKNCECTSIGSIKQSCDVLTGQCECKEGYSGQNCEYCAKGYYGYPNCQKCNCDIRGSKYYSYGKITECDENGQCPCKELVTGLKCDECRQSTFGLSQYNPNGCTRCFCFGRSQECSQNDLIWGQVRLMGPRKISVQYITEHQSRYNSEIEYIVLSHMKNNHIYRENAELSTFNGLSVLPGLSGDLTIGSRRAFNKPFYIELPKEFCGDKTSSYGGFLNFSLTNYEFRSVLDHEYLHYPLVQMHTHHHLTLNFYQTVEIKEEGNSFSIILHETYWRHATNGYNISRAIMMTALQNIKHIYLRVTSSSDFISVTLQNSTMNIGLVRNGNNNAAMASGIEKCVCSEIYSGDSCQDPADGYYRWRNVTIPTNMLEDLVGKIIPCECNGRSSTCDKETGECLDCLDNTGGFNCEKCAEGFYGHPDRSGCKSCPCPETNKKFAKGCFVDQQGVSCFCKEGYTGALCDRCAKGYFGQPHEPEGKCESCDCNIEGIVSDECDYLNGQCNCKKGVTGRRCEKCELPRHLLVDYECQLCDNCTQTLLDSIDEMMYSFNVNLDGVDLHKLKAPWFKLNELTNLTNIYSNTFDDFFQAVDAVDNFNDIATDELLLQSENLQNKANRFITTTDKKIKKIEELKTKSEDLITDARDQSSSIQESIINLESYGTSDHHIKLPNALKEAKLFLDEIAKKSQNVPNTDQTTKCANDNFDFWSEELKNTKEQKDKLDKLIKDKETLQNRINDFKNLTHRVFRDSSETEAFITKNKNDFEKLKEKAAQLETQALEVDKLLNENVVAASASRLESVNDNLDKAKITNDNLLNMYDEVDKTLSERNDEINLIKNSQLTQAQRHAQDLSDRSKVIVSLFQHSKDGAQLAVRAGTAYSKIAESINEANKAANKAYEAAVHSNQQLNPADPDEETMLEKGNDLALESVAIQEDAEKQVDKIKELKKFLNQQQELVKKMSSTIHNSGKLNNEMSSLITKLSNNEARNSIQDSANLIDDVLEDIKNTDTDVNEIGDNVSILKEKLALLDPEWDSKFGLAEEQVTKTLIDIREANRTWTTHEDRIKKQQERFGAWNDSISTRLQELRDKITKAKHAAENIRVSLESSDDSCVRSFYPPITGVSISNQVVMTFALNSRNINSPLIFVEGDDGKFLALEMFNRKIYFIWNLGGDSGTIIHPLEIQTRDPKYDDAWYKIEISRNLNLGSLIVSRMTNSGTFTQSTPVNGATTLNFTRFSISNHNRIYIGGVPDNLRPKEMQMKNGLSVIIHQIFIDDKQIGLWHFASSEGKCEGAMLGATESSDNSNSRYFNGNGYSVVYRVNSRPPRWDIFSLQMTFRTMDENALLFLTVDETNNRSISLTIHEGKLVFRIDYGDESLLEINTTNRYNTGKWVSVEAARQFTKAGNTENGMLKVNNDDEHRGSPSKPVIRAMLPSISKAPFYIGGVSPDFKSGTTKAPGAENGFIGCMRDLQINGEIFDPLESQNFYGIEPTCKETINKVGFYGSGYLEMPSHSFKTKGNFGFVFRTLQTDCLLLFSGFPPQAAEDFDGKDERGNFSISLINGQIVFWVDAGKGKIELKTNSSYNDGEFHVIYVNKNRKKFELRVDDKLEAFKSFQTPTRVNSPEEYGLFIGGAPDFPEFDNVVPTFNGLRGSIRDLVFNNKTISFDIAINYKSVNFGGYGPSMGLNSEQEIKTEPIAAKFKEVTEGCQRVSIF